MRACSLHHGLLLLCAACGAVEPVEPDAAGANDAAAAADADTPAPDGAPTIDAGPDCVSDSFTGDALDPHWTLIAGAVPTHEVSTSRLLITDAAFAETANPPVSWINELDTDKANQLGWAQDIGDADFTIIADIGWSSADPELTFGGVAIANSQGEMSALVGTRDGSTSLNGQPTAQFLVRDDLDVEYNGAREEPGSAIFRLQRRDGVVEAFVDDVSIGTDPSPQDVAYVSVFAVRHRSATNNEYQFGSVEIRDLEICRP
jgi:hypothetical protein